MCYRLQTNIEIEDKTSKGKYEFLKMYYTLWNQITKSSPRIIIDTHAGTGVVDYKKRDGSVEQIFGSPLLAILKTITISNNLKLIFIEKNSDNFDRLSGYLDRIEREGLSVLYSIEKKSIQRELFSDKKSDETPKSERIFPEKFDFKIPDGYKEKKLKSKAKIIKINNKVEKCFDNIVNEHLGFVQRKKRDGTTYETKPKVIFLVDPCKSIKWDFIEKIGKLSQNLKGEKEEGIELILNWNAGAIYRNPGLGKIKESILGLSEKELKAKFADNDDLEKYLEFYKEKLRKFWKHICVLGVPLTGSYKKKKRSTESYFVIFCTNNDSGYSLALNKIEKLKESLICFDFKSLREF